MGSPFSSSMRSLAKDRLSPSVLMVSIATLILGLWATWMFSARINVYEMSDSGRFEVDTALYPIASPVSGRVTAIHLAVGQEVRQGDLLVEFESEDEKLRMNEAGKQLSAFPPQLNALRDEVAAEEAARKEQIKAAQIAIDQARSQLEEARASVQLAEDEARRAEQLRVNGLVSEVDLARARTEVRKQRAAAEALRLQIDKLQANLRNGDSDSQVRIERLNRQILSVEGEIKTATAAQSRLSHDIEKRAIRAPVSGRIGEAVDLRAGAVVSAGDKIGVIIPTGELKVVAYFRPSSAIGRIRPGQPARLRLEGFPWTQYGVINATVTTVANEPRDGRIRIDLTMQRPPDSAIPFQHGLPATVEVEVARLSPAALLLLNAGERIKPTEATSDNRGARSE